MRFVRLLLLLTACGHGPLEGTWRLSGNIVENVPGGIALALEPGNFELDEPDAESVALHAFGCELRFRDEGVARTLGLSPRVQSCVTTEPVPVPGDEAARAPPLFVRFEGGAVQVTGGYLSLQLLGSLQQRDFRLDASGRLVRQ